MSTRLLRRPLSLKIRTNARFVATSKKLLHSDYVLTDEIGDKGVLILNRPKAKNALNTEMFKKLYATIDNWRNTKSMIIIKSSVPNVFSAGGDLTSVAQANPPESGRDLFRVAYSLDYIISNLKIPQVAFNSNGITIGGGFAMSIFGAYQIASEKTIFMMPEAAIGKLNVVISCQN